MIFDWVYGTKTKADKIFRERIIIQELMNYSLGMFEYDNLPPTIEGRFIELYLLKWGMVGWGKIKGNDNLYVAEASPCGDVDAYSIGTEITCATPLGTISGKIGKDCVLGWNNALGSPDSYIYWLTHMLEQTDFSMETNIKYARLKPMPVVRNTAQKTLMDKALENLDTLDLTSVVSDNALALETGGELLPILNLTDVKNVDKIQYLSSLHDDLMRRFWNRKGLGVQSKDKQAQVNSDELHSLDSNAWVEPLENLKYRKKMIDEVNDLFNQNITVHFGGVWKIEYEKYERSLALESADESANESADKSADGNADKEKGDGENV